MKQKFLILIFISVCGLFLSGCGQTSRHTGDDSSGSGSKGPDNNPPTITKLFTAPTAPNSNITPFRVTFNADAADPDNDNLTYLWDFGDGTTAKGQTSVHIYNYQGTFYYSLTVTDEHGAFARMTGHSPVNITGGNRQPEINLILITPITANTGESIAFSCDTSDPDGDELTHEWSFGDGATSSSTAPNHAYAADGIYTVTLIVTDTHGAARQKNAVVGIGNNVQLPPVINDFSFSPGTAVPPCTITFAGDAVDYDGIIISYAWDFGDGSTATGSSPNHLFEYSGTFTVTLTVTDNDGKTARLEKIISVGEGLE